MGVCVICNILVSNHYELGNGLLISGEFGMYILWHSRWECASSDINPCFLWEVMKNAKLHNWRLFTILSHTSSSNGDQVSLEVGLCTG